MVLAKAQTGFVGGECWSSAQVLCKISAMTKDIGNAFSFPLVTEDCSSSIWLPPPPSWIKVNVDGSVYWSLNRGGVGGFFVILMAFGWEDSLV